MDSLGPDVSRLFKPGEIAVWQDVWRGAVWKAVPTVVVEDDGEVMVTHLVPGSLYKSQPLRLGMSRYDAPDDVADRQRERIFASLRDPSKELVDCLWERNRRLTLFRTGARHCVSLFWRDQDGEFLGWYVDFVEPVRRTPIGIATMDQMLDIEIEPDITTWSWKDADDFEAAMASGIYHAEVAAEVRAEATVVIERIARRDWPFNTSWPSWRHDPNGAPPALPADWSRVF